MVLAKSSNLGTRAAPRGYQKCRRGRVLREEGSAQSIPLRGSYEGPAAYGEARDVTGEVTILLAAQEWGSIPKHGQCSWCCVGAELVGIVLSSLVVSGKPCLEVARVLNGYTG